MRLLSRLFAVILILPITALAQQASTLQLPDSADVRIIVDISGSMKTNDPDNLRRPAVRLLARMLPGQANAGVWTFGQYVNMLVPHGKVTDDWRGLAVERSDEINSVALRTNLGEAIQVASDDYLLGSESLDNTDFILLTDGKVDISDNESANDRERERILGALLDDLSSRGATLHTVALSEEADLALLKSLAERTGGRYALASSADALTLAFLEALNTAVPQQQIPIEDNGFQVDGGVEEFTALIFRAGDESAANRTLELVSPGGTKAGPDSATEGMRWVRETEYDLITVTDPEAGDWTINGELGEGSRVTVVSDLRMVVSPVPPTFTENEPVSLQVAFFEEDRKIENRDFLGVIDVSVSLTSEDGRSGNKVLSPDGPPQDGVYTDTITRLPDAGEYQLSVVADGQTFSRRFSTVTRYIQPEGEQAPIEAVVSDEPSQEVSVMEDELPEASPAPENESPVSSSGPIDISQVEEPEPKPLEEQPVDKEEAEPETPATVEEAASGIPFWVWAAAGTLGVVAVAGVAFLFVKRRKSAQDQGNNEEPPLVAEETPEEEATAAPESEQAPEDVPAEIPEPEPVPEPEPEPEPEELPEPEEVPELQQDEALPEDDIPVADAEVEDGEDEFGLEDFDLSEFDDLPATDEDSEPTDDESENDDKDGGKDR
ncbi:vWA domain-containing protein [Marinobacter salarius]|uniref:vWA domain-containing protein n=1 Tax=Marinobacter salarius TaxID=1420917 RepID=UPI003D11C802